MDLLERLEQREQMEEERFSLGFEGRNNILELVLTSAIFLMIIIAAVVYVLNSNVIYSGETSTYWDICRNIVKGKLEPDFWRNVYHSIGTRENNFIPAIIPSFWMSVFGTSRLVYVLTIVIFYILPAVVLVKRLAVKFTEMPIIGMIAGVFMLPFSLYMALNGYVDVGAMTIGLFCYNMYYTKDGPSKNVFIYILIGAMLILSMLISSYFAFFAISFLTAMCIEAMLGDGKWKYTIFTVITFGILSVTVCRQFFTGVLFDVYGALSISKFGFVWNNIRILTHCVGALFILLVIIIPCLLRRNKAAAKTSFIWTQVIIMAATFMTTHQCEIKHMLMFIPAFIVLTIITAGLADSTVLLVGICTIILGNILGVCLSSGDMIRSKNIQHISAVPSFSILPEYDSTAADVVKLKRTLDAFVPQGALCGVLGKSDAFNATKIKNAEESLRFDVGRDYEYIRELPSIDETDASRLQELYEIEYLLAAFPAQTYGNGGQTIINEAIASFELYSDIATAFTEVEGFNMMVGDTNVKLYRRIADLTYSEINQYQQRLYY